MRMAPQEFRCKKCRKLCSTKKKKEDHEMTCKFSLHCHLCNKTCSSKRALDAHITLHKTRGSSFVPTTREKKDRWTCKDQGARNLRIPKDFQGIYDFSPHSGNYLNYGTFIVKMNEPEYSGPTCSFESVRYGDIHGPQHDVPNSRIRNFVMDKTYSGKQAKTENYDTSGYNKGHLANAANHSMNAKDYNTTCTFTNCVPLSSAINSGELSNMEKEVISVVRNTGGALVITSCEFSTTKETMRFLKDDTEVPIPEAVGKHLIYRTPKGLHIDGMKTTQPNVAQKSEASSKTTSGPIGLQVRSVPFYDPFKLAEEMIMELKVKNSDFAFINGAANPAFQANEANGALFPIKGWYLEMLAEIDADDKPSSNVKNEIEVIEIDD